MPRRPCTSRYVDSALEQSTYSPLWPAPRASSPPTVSYTSNVASYRATDISHRTLQTMLAFPLEHDRYFCTLCRQNVVNAFLHLCILPSVLWCCWLDGRKGIQSVKKLSGGMLAWLSVWGDVQICIWPSCQQLIPLPLTISCSSKSRLVLTWYRGSPG